MSEKQKRKNVPLTQTFRQKYGILLAFNLYFVILIMAGIILELILPYSRDVYYPIVDTLLRLASGSIYVLLLATPFLLRWGWRRFRQGYRTVFFLTLVTSLIFSTIAVLNHMAEINMPVDLRYHANVSGVDYYVAKVFTSGGILYSSGNEFYTPPYNSSDEAHISIYACNMGGWRCPVVEHSEIRIIWADGWYDITDDGIQIIVTYKDKQDGETKIYTCCPG